MHLCSKFRKEEQLEEEEALMEREERLKEDEVEKRSDKTGVAENAREDACGLLCEHCRALQQEHNGEAEQQGEEGEQQQQQQQQQQEREEQRQCWHETRERLLRKLDSYIAAVVAAESTEQQNAGSGEGAVLVTQTRQKQQQQVVMALQEDLQQQLEKLLLLHDVACRRASRKLLLPQRLHVLMKGNAQSGSTDSTNSSSTRRAHNKRNRVGNAPSAEGSCCLETTTTRSIRGANSRSSSSRCGSNCSNGNWRRSSRRNNTCRGSGNSSSGRRSSNRLKACGGTDGSSKEAEEAACSSSALSSRETRQDAGPPLLWLCAAERKGQPSGSSSGGGETEEWRAQLLQVRLNRQYFQRAISQPQQLVEMQQRPHRHLAGQQRHQVLDQGPQRQQLRQHEQQPQQQEQVQLLSVPQAWRRQGSNRQGKRQGKTSSCSTSLVTAVPLVEWNERIWRFRWIESSFPVLPAARTSAYTKAKGWLLLRLQQQRLPVLQLLLCLNLPLLQADGGEMHHEVEQLEQLLRQQLVLLQEQLTTTTLHQHAADAAADEDLQQLLLAQILRLQQLQLVHRLRNEGRSAEEAAAAAVLLQQPRVSILPETPPSEAKAKRHFTMLPFLKVVQTPYRPQLQEQQQTEQRHHIEQQQQSQEQKRPQRQGHAQQQQLVPLQQQRWQATRPREPIQEREQSKHQQTQQKARHIKKCLPQLHLERQRHIQQHHRKGVSVFCCRRRVQARGFSVVQQQKDGKKNSYKDIEWSEIRQMQQHVLEQLAFLLRYPHQGATDKVVDYLFSSLQVLRNAQCYGITAKQETKRASIQQTQQGMEETQMQQQLQQHVQKLGTPPQEQQQQHTAPQRLRPKAEVQGQRSFEQQQQHVRQLVKQVTVLGSCEQQGRQREVQELEVGAVVTALRVFVLQQLRGLQERLQRAAAADYAAVLRWLLQRESCSYEPSSRDLSGADYGSGGNTGSARTGSAFPNIGVGSDVASSSTGTSTRVEEEGRESGESCKGGSSDIRTSSGSNKHGSSSSGHTNVECLQSPLSRGCLLQCNEVTAPGCWTGNQSSCRSDAGVLGSDTYMDTSDGTGLKSFLKAEERSDRCRFSITRCPLGSADPEDALCHAFHCRHHKKKRASISAAATTKTLPNSAAADDTGKQQQTQSGKVDFSVTAKDRTQRESASGSAAASLSSLAVCRAAPADCFAHSWHPSALLLRECVTVGRAKTLLEQQIALLQQPLATGDSSAFSAWPRCREDRWRSRRYQRSTTTTCESSSCCSRRSARDCGSARGSNKSCSESPASKNSSSRSCRQRYSLRRRTNDCSAADRGSVCPLWRAYYWYLGLICIEKELLFQQQVRAAQVALLRSEAEEDVEEAVLRKLMTMRKPLLQQLRQAHAAQYQTSHLLLRGRKLHCASLESRHPAAWVFPAPLDKEKVVEDGAGGSLPVEPVDEEREIGKYTKDKTVTQQQQWQQRSGETVEWCLGTVADISEEGSEALQRHSPSLEAACEFFYPSKRPQYLGSEESYSSVLLSPTAPRKRSRHSSCCTGVQRT